MQFSLMLIYLKVISVPVKHSLHLAQFQALVQKKISNKSQIFLFSKCVINAWNSLLELHN